LITCCCVGSGKSSVPSIWPPPAPPEYIDRSQLLTNLRPASFAATHRPDEQFDERSDESDTDAAAAADADDDDGARLIRQRSLGSATGPLKPSTDTAEHHRDSEFHHPASGDADGGVPRRSSLDVSRDHHQLKRTSSDESDVRAKRPPSDRASYSSNVSPSHVGGSLSHGSVISGEDAHTTGKTG